MRFHASVPRLPSSLKAAIMEWRRAPKLHDDAYDAPIEGQMSNSVTINVPARLHLGFLDLNGDAGRRFGSLGLPLSEPETVVTLSHARRDGGRRRREPARRRTPGRALPASRHSQPAPSADRTLRSRAMPVLAPARRSRWPSLPRCARCTACRSTSAAMRRCWRAAPAPASASPASSAAASSSTPARTTAASRRRSWRGCPSRTSGACCSFSTTPSTACMGQTRSRRSAICRPFPPPPPAKSAGTC